MKLPKELTTATPFSKFLTSILFFTFIISGFLVGTRYQEIIDFIKYQQYNLVATLSSLTPVNKTANWKTYSNTEEGFEIKYPKNWEYNAGPLPKVFLFGTTGSSDHDVNISVELSSQLDKFYGINKNKICIEDALNGKKINKCEGNSYIYVEVENNGKFYLLSVKGDKSSDKFSIFDQILSTFKFINQNQVAPADIGEKFCGGFAGTSCPTGYKCQLDGNYPDAGGKCIKQ